MNPEVPTGQGLLLQAIGILPLAFLTFLLGRSIQRPYLRFWWPAWTALAGALFALYLARWLPQLRGGLEALYFFGEYVFGGLLVAGCRSLASGTAPGRRAAWLFVPALALALILPRVHAPFAVRFIPQAAVMGVLFGLALRELRRGPGVRGGIGTSLLKASLLAQALFFLHYVPVLSWAAWNGHGVAAAYSSTAAVFDLLFETLLGLATVVVVLEREHHDLEQANAELREARGKLEALARVDPLTSSLNRHAFYSMVEGGRSEAGGEGCVAVADLDSLKADQRRARARRGGRGHPRRGPGDPAGGAGGRPRLPLGRRRVPDRAVRRLRGGGRFAARRARRDARGRAGPGLAAARDRLRLDGCRRLRVAREPRAGGRARGCPDVPVQAGAPPLVGGGGATRAERRAAAQASSSGVLPR